MVPLTGISQVVVEKKLIRENNVTRHDIGRERFVSQVSSFFLMNNSRLLLLPYNIHFCLVAIIVQHVMFYPHK